MAGSFEKWMDRQLKAKGRAEIDKETYNEIYFPFPDYMDYSLKHLRLDWPDWIRKAGEEYDSMPPGQDQREGYIHHRLEKEFYTEFNVIKSYFSEYYTLFGLFDRPYFKRIVNDFRKHFPPDHRAPGIKYFDDLVIEFTAEYNSGELVKPPLKFADFLNHDDPNQLINKLKQKFPTGQNKEAAIMVTALESAGLIFEIENETDLISAIKKEWNTDFVYESYMKPRRAIRQRRIDKKSDTAELIEATKFVIGCK